MIALGLGSNIGNREDYIRRAVEELSGEFSINKVSDIYETKAWGEENQPDFLNACLTVETDMSPEEILEIVKSIEAKLGRTESYRWGPREIDIDILLLDNQQITSQRFAQDRCDEWRKTNRENHNHVSAYPRSAGAGREATEHSVLYL